MNRAVHVAGVAQVPKPYFSVLGPRASLEFLHPIGELRISHCTAGVQVPSLIFLLALVITVPNSLAVALYLQRSLHGAELALPNKDSLVVSETESKSSRAVFDFNNKHAVIQRVILQSLDSSNQRFQTISWELDARVELEVIILSINLNGGPLRYLGAMI